MVPVAKLLAYHLAIQTEPSIGMQIIVLPRPVVEAPTAMEEDKISFGRFSTL